MSLEGPEHLGQGSEEAGAPGIPSWPCPRFLSASKTSCPNPVSSRRPWPSDPHGCPSPCLSPSHVARHPQPSLPPGISGLVRIFTQAWKPPAGAQPQAAPSPLRPPQLPTQHALVLLASAHAVCVEVPSPLHPCQPERQALCVRARASSTGGGGEGQRRGWRPPIAPVGAQGPRTGCFSNPAMGPRADTRPLLFSHCCS